MNIFGIASGVIKLFNNVAGFLREKNLMEAGAAKQQIKEIAKTKRLCKMPVNMPRLLAILCVSVLISSCSLSGVERIDAGCEIWRNYTPSISSQDTEKTVRSVIVFNETMEKACDF